MLDNTTLSLRPGRVEEFVMNIFEDLEQQGIIPILVEEYAQL